MRIALRLSFLALFVSAPAVAQTAATVVVKDDRGAPVPFAVITLVGGVTQIADDSGRARFQINKRDSAQFHVRRIGHREFKGWVRNDSASFNVLLPPSFRPVDTVRVTAARDQTPLERTGFYDRVNRVQRGAIVAEFITPEELDSRNVAEISRMLDGRRSVRVKRQGRKPVLTGRGGCGMTLIVDGQRVNGTIEDMVQPDVPQSIDGMSMAAGGGVGGRDVAQSMLTVDDVVNGLSVMAIEIYPSTANAPAELQTLGGRGSCGIVAIWTGPRK